MALTKRTYVDGETIITAQNLNDIQDEIIAHESNKVPTTRTVNGKALSSNITLNASNIPNDSTVSGENVDDAFDTLKSLITSNQLINLKWIRDLTNGEDLDGLYINGWYTTGNGHTYINSPIPNDTVGQRIVVVMAYNNETSTSYRHMFYANRSYGIYAHRCYTSGRWSAWNTYGCTFLSESFTPSANSRPADYATGEIVRIGTYNVANYNFDTSSYMNNGQMLEFRKFIAESKLDFLLTQEDRQYIGADSSAPLTNDYLYYPLLRQYNRDGKWNSIIRSHANSITTSGTHGRIVFSNVELDTASRSIEFCCFTVGSYTLLLCDTHCIWKDVDTDPESATSIAARKTNYEELFAWINGTITLRKYGNGTAVTVPTHTHAIVCMDANCITDTDKANLANAASTNNFELCNGGRFGWFKTCFDRYGSYALDEIAVSSNCIITDVTARTDLYPKLYSDHVPVIAEVSLMPS